MADSVKRGASRRELLVASLAAREIIVATLAQVYAIADPDDFQGLRGALREDPSIYTGQDDSGTFLASSPIEVTDAVMQRGAERYAIYCRPCHDKRGTGQGIMTERGRVPVPSYGEQRIVDLPDGEMFDVITNGKGLMKGDRYPVPAADRWAIIAHVRNLQRELATADVAQARP